MDLFLVSTVVGVQYLSFVRCTLWYSLTMVYGTVPRSTAQHSTAPMGTASNTLHMAQVLMDNAGETLIGYIIMVNDVLSKAELPIYML